MTNKFVSSLEFMASSRRISDSEIFVQAPSTGPKAGRHSELVKLATGMYGSENTYVDCSTSVKLLSAAAHVTPCVCPTHSMFSARLNRYLLPGEFMRLQGLFPSCYKPEVYEEYEQIGQNVAGNSFSSTVCQAAVLASMASCPNTWSGFTKENAAPLQRQGMSIDQGSTKSLGSVSEVVATFVQTNQDDDHASTKNLDTKVETVCGKQLMRIRGKRKAPEFDAFWKPEPKRKALGKNRKYIYRRKKPGMDSRKLSKGKHKQVSIAKKMAVLLGWLCGLYSTLDWTWHIFHT